MRTEHLQCLLEVVKCRSISTAAKKLYISQTGLSAIINSVETELNIKIFRRTNKGTLLTPDGEQAIKLIEEILAKNDELHYLYSNNSQQNQILNLGVFPSGAYALSRYLVKSWAKQHRYTHLYIYEVGFEDFHNCINNHTANIVVGAESSDFLYMLPARNGKLYLEPLCGDHFCALVSARSALADRERVAVEDLWEKHLLLTHHYPSPQDKPIGSIIHRFKHFTVLNNIETAKRILAEEEDMLMLCPSFALLGDGLVSSGQLKAIEVTGFPPELTIFMMCDLTSKLSLQETMLMQEIRNFFSEYQKA